MFRNVVRSLNHLQSRCASRLSQNEAVDVSQIKKVFSTPTTKTVTKQTERRFDHPVIPRVRTVIKYPMRMPHPGVTHLSADISSWVDEIISRSAPLDEVTRQFLADAKQSKFFETGTFYMTFSVNPICSYQNLVDATKHQIWISLIDDLFETQQHDIRDQILEYLDEVRPKPGARHNSDKDSKRWQLLDQLSRPLIRRLPTVGNDRPTTLAGVQAIDVYCKQNSAFEPPGKLDHNTYWKFRLDNAYVESVSIACEATFGIELTGPMLEDPNVRSAIDAAYKVCIITNDLVSYFRERELETDFDSNYIAFIGKLFNVNEQTAVDMTIEQTVLFHEQAVHSVKMAVKSPLAYEELSVDMYLRMALPQYTYGILRAYDRVGRNYMDMKNHGDLGKMRKVQTFLNESYPGNAGVDFRPFLKRDVYKLCRRTKKLTDFPTSR